MKSFGRDPTIHETINPGKVINSVAFHKDMKTLAIAGNDSILHLWNLASKKSLVYRDHTAQILTLAYSNNSPLLASGSKDETIRIWDSTNDRKSKVIKGHHGPVRSVEFSSDGEILVSGSDDKTVKIWDVGTLKFKASYIGHNNWVRTARFSPDSSLIASAGEDTKIILWETEKKKPLLEFIDHQKRVNDVRFYEDCIVSCSDDKTIQFHDPKTSKLVQLYTNHSDSVREIGLFGNHMVSVANDAEIRIWDIRKGLPLYTLYSHKGPIRCCTISKFGNYIATGGEDKKVIVWNSGFEGIGQQEIKYFDMCKTGHRADPRTMVNYEDYVKMEGIRQQCERRRMSKEKKRIPPQEKQIEKLEMQIEAMENNVNTLSGSKSKYYKKTCAPGKRSYEKVEERRIPNHHQGEDDEDEDSDY